MTIFKKTILLASLLLAAAGAAHAEDNTERAIRNSMRTMEYLHAVTAAEIQRPLQAIESGKFKRVAEDQPMWIVEILSGTILYYQGQPEFKNQPAVRLVDDNGFRFGDRAVAYGKASKSGFMRIALGEKKYQTYCKSQYPFVVCTLII